MRPSKKRNGSRQGSIQTAATTFDRLVYKRGIVPNLICAILIFVYSIFFLLIRPAQIPLAIALAAAVSLGAEFLISPITNGVLTKKITQDIQDWEAGLIADERGRTELYLEIAAFPMKKALQTFLFFFSCVALLSLGYRLVPGLAFQWTVIAVSFTGCVFGSYAAGIFAQSYAEDICSAYARRLIKEGIDKAVIAENKSFGMSLALRCAIYLIVPCLYITFVTYMMARQYFAHYIVTDADRLSIIARNIIITVINAVFYLRLFFLVQRKLTSYADEMGGRLNEILTEKDPAFYIETNLFDSLQYSNYLVNETARGFTGLISHIKSVSSKMLETANNLAAISKELQATANEQNTSVSEIHSIVKDMNSSMQDIKGRVESVADGCQTMNGEVLSSLAAVGGNLEQIRRIDESNRKIMTCVESLGRQTNSIGEVMSLIEDIASQTRIIAFNAELEAVGAGKAGKNFHIISSEIKRLADSVVKSIQESQNHIKDLKDASLALSVSSANTTRLIEDETAMSDELEAHLQDIKLSARNTSNRAGEIRENIERQSSSFEEITGTLGQINSSIANFTLATAEINSAASQIQAASLNLDALE